MRNNETIQFNSPTKAVDALILTAMYEVAFNRLPDVEGFQYWMSEIDNGSSIHEVARMWSAFIPQFSQYNTQAVINTFSLNGYEHVADVSVQNYWGVLAVNAVPSYELLYDMSVQLVGLPNDTHNFFVTY